MSALLMIFLSLGFAQQKIDVKVRGMVCAFCVQGIEKKMKDFKEVASVSVDLDSKMVHIETHKGQTLEKDKIETTIKNAGFEVVEMKIK